MNSSLARNIELSTSNPTVDTSGPKEISLSVHGMTCGSCVEHVQEVLKAIPGVETAEVTLARGSARVRYNPARATLEALKEAVGNAGCTADELSTNTETGLSREKAVPGSRPIPRLPVVIGIVAAMALAGIYLGIVTVAQSWDHAVELFTTDWYFVLGITAGFGTQVGLFTYIRTSILAPGRTGSTVAVTGAGTGTSTVSMLACLRSPPDRRVAPSWAIRGSYLPHGLPCAVHGIRDSHQRRRHRRYAAPHPQAPRGGLSHIVLPGQGFAIGRVS